jgi:hypothetical protein
MTDRLLNYKSNGSRYPHYITSAALTQLYEEDAGGLIEGFLENFHFGMTFARYASAPD